MGAPALILFLAFYLYPALQNLQFATRRWDGITEPENVGFRNFTNLLTNDDLFYKTLGNNIEFTFLVVLFQTSLALLSLPNQLSAKEGSPTLVKKRLIAPKLGSYKKSQIIPTDTEERIVGKK